MSNAFSFKNSFLMGVATASTQIEGGVVDNNWNDWYLRGGIHDGSNPARADQHWDLWKEDTKLMKKMGLQIYRFGIEWARLIPEPGSVDQEAIRHYRDELTEIKRCGIKPLLTIHHFSNPMWFERLGGFSKKENARYYLELVDVVIDSFGDLVDEFITINEPNVYAGNGYLFGQWPPAKKNFFQAMKVMDIMAYCHIMAYRKIHEKLPNAQVGFANHLRVFAPQNSHNPVHILCSRFAAWAFQGALTEAFALGRFRFPLCNRFHISRGQYADFHGLNYYSRSSVSGLSDGTCAHCAVNDLGWEIYPHGLVECAEFLLNVLERPIWVTENGTCDLEDSFRNLYLYEHLKTIAKSDLPFERYYHWCFLDNFEWAEGESARFGLVHVDYDSQKRTIKNSGHFYSQIIRDHGVTEQSYDQYVAGLNYHWK